jgi:hypothetical protein
VKSICPSSGSYNTMASILAASMSLQLSASPRELAGA